MAVDLPRLRDEGIFILVLLEARDGLAPIACEGLSIGSLLFVLQPSNSLKDIRELEVILY